MQTSSLIAAIAASLVLAGCADEGDNQQVEAGTTGSAISQQEADLLRQQVAQLEQRLTRLERTAVVVGGPPEDVSGENAADGTGNQATQANAAPQETNQTAE